MGPLQVGATLSRKYRIERLLAESGGVILYEATDTARSQRVWIKILLRDANSDAQTRFQREASGAKVLDVGKNDDGLPYMVAAEFGAALDTPPPPRTRPPPLGTKSAKATLPGVAPPAVDPDDEPPPSSEIPLLGDAEETPRPPEPAPKPIPKLTPAPEAPIASPFASPIRPIYDDDDDGDGDGDEEDVRFDDDEAPTRPIPELKRALEQTNPSIRVLQMLREQERKRRAAAWRWAMALPLVVGASMVGGWYVGHRQAEPVARPAPVATTTADPTESLPAATPAPTTEPAPVAPTATATAPAARTAAAAPSAEPASPVATEAPTMLPTRSTTEAPAMLPTHAARPAKPSHAAARPHHHTPPPPSDPLTL